jgi:hypothetical protein
MNPYYGVRRLGPYLGVIQVIDVGDTCAYSTNGRTWRIRQQTASGRFRWGVTQVSSEDVNEVRLVNADELVQALKKQPPIPFPNSGYSTARPANHWPCCVPATKRWTWSRSLIRTGGPS